MFLYYSRKSDWFGIALILTSTVIFWTKPPGGAYDKVAFNSHFGFSKSSHQIRAYNSFNSKQNHCSYTHPYLIFRVDIEFRRISFMTWVPYFPLSYLILTIRISLSPSLSISLSLCDDTSLAYFNSNVCSTVSLLLRRTPFSPFRLKGEWALSFVPSHNSVEIE